MRTDARLQKLEYDAAKAKKKDQQAVSQVTARQAKDLDSDEVIEYGTLDWNAGGVEFTLTDAYTSMPCVTAGVSGTASDFSSAAFVLVITHTQETVGGVANCYSRVTVTPKGSAVPTPTGAKLSMMAICQVNDMVERPVS